MTIIIISFYLIVTCIVFSSFNRHLFDELFAHRLCSIFFWKIFFLYSNSWLLCFKYYCDEKFTFVITLEHILRIRQIIFKNSIIFTKRKFLSTHEIIKFFSLLFILQNIFYFVFFLFAYKNHFCKKKQYLHLYNMTLREIDEKRNRFFIDRISKNDKSVTR